MTSLKFQFLKGLYSLNIGALGHTLPCLVHFTVLLSQGNFAAKPKEGQGYSVTCPRALAHKQ